MNERLWALEICPTTRYLTLSTTYLNHNHTFRGTRTAVTFPFYCAPAVRRHTRSSILLCTRRREFRKMTSSVWLLLCATVAWGSYSYISGLTSNLAKARKTNLPYIVVRKSVFLLIVAKRSLTFALPAVHPFNRFWQISAWIWLPLIKSLPKAWWEKWLL